MYIITYSWKGRRHIYGERRNNFYVFKTKAAAQRELKVLKERPDLWKNPRISQVTVKR